MTPLSATEAAGEAGRGAGCFTVRYAAYLLDHPDTPQRMLWSWDAGLNTAEIALWFGIDEAIVETILIEERAIRRRAQADSGSRRHARLQVAWEADDVDRDEVARRFGMDRRAARNALAHRRQLLREIAGVEPGLPIGVHPAPGPGQSDRGRAP